MRWLRKFLGVQGGTGRSVTAGGRDRMAVHRSKWLHPARTSTLCALRSPVELSLVESVLAGAGIPYGTAGHSGFGSLHAVTLFVRTDDLSQARELLASLDIPTEVAPADPPAGRGTEPRPAGDGPT